MPFWALLYRKFLNNLITYQPIWLSFGTIWLEFHGFYPLSLDSVFLDQCLARIQPQMDPLINGIKVIRDPNSTVTPSSTNSSVTTASNEEAYKRLLFSYLILSDLVHEPIYSIAHDLPINVRLSRCSNN